MKKVKVLGLSHADAKTLAKNFEKEANKVLKEMVKSGGRVLDVKLTSTNINDRAALFIIL